MFSLVVNLAITSLDDTKTSPVSKREQANRLNIQYY